MYFFVLRHYYQLEQPMHSAEVFKSKKLSGKHALIGFCSEHRQSSGNS